MTTVLIDHRVPADVPDGTRVDRYLADHTSAFPSRKAARKACKRGEVWLNGAPVESSRVLRPGDAIAVRAPERAPPGAWDADLALPYVDPWLAVVVKPPGMPVHGPHHRTLVNALVAALPPSAAADALPWPYPSHRLDVRTGGLMLVARTGAAQVALGAAFAERRITKRYRALVIGRLEGEGSVDAPVGGRPALSDWRAVAHHRSLRAEWLTTVDLWPRTGRTHQLREHVAGLGHAILGDDLYGDPATTLRGKGLFLWSVALGLQHPITGAALAVETEDPRRLLTWRARDAARWRRRAASTSTDPTRDRTGA